tara:strand:+ start:122 stop:493 length:372 start_codon:yes stop_codon:yes gene_type:complete
MRIKEGECYVNGNGDKVGPMLIYDKDSMAVDGEDKLWGLDGKRLYTANHGPTCLVSVWIDTELVWGEWVYDQNKWYGTKGAEQCERNKLGHYFRHRTPKNTRVEGSLEIDQDGEPDFSTWVKK